MLQAEGLECIIRRVETEAELMKALQEMDCDLILSDCTLPQYHGLEALKIVHAIRPELPFIFISGTIGEETAIRSLQSGATDYVLKQRLSRLIPAVRRAMTEADSKRELTALEGQLRQSRKLETIGTLAGELAHDFKNLLQVLKVSIELLPVIANNPQQVTEIAAKMKTATERGCTMAQELLVFARKTDAKLMPVNMANEISDMAAMLHDALPPHINLSLDLEKNLPLMQADPDHLNRIVTNLVMNARDAMPDGGEIGICTDLVRFDRIPANAWQINDVPYLRLRIMDTGTGMNEETQSRIFEPFFTTKPIGKGTGLGLSVVFGLMEAHQGYIDVVSKVGEGTTFSLLFPLPPTADVSQERVHTIFPTRLLGKTNQIDTGSLPRLSVRG
ncbi:MAG: ATP-binding protein [Methylacidiphilales bacterium]|nr:ATP-binding protein [Candidatus Methylacidiphilales bacterium]